MPVVERSLFRKDSGVRNTIGIEPTVDSQAAVGLQGVEL